MVFTMAVQLQRSMVLVVTLSTQIACMTHSRQPSSSNEQKVGSELNPNDSFMSTPQKPITPTSTQAYPLCPCLDTCNLLLKDHLALSDCTAKENACLPWLGSVSRLLDGFSARQMHERHVQSSAIRPNAYTQAFKVISFSWGPPVWCLCRSQQVAKHNKLSRFPCYKMSTKLGRFKY